MPNAHSISSYSTPPHIPSMASSISFTFHHPEIMLISVFYFFFFNDTATTEIYTLSLHDALPISDLALVDQAFLRLVHELDRVLDGENMALLGFVDLVDHGGERRGLARTRGTGHRSEEHTSELQSLTNLVCRLLLEKKKRQKYIAD